MNRTLSVYVHWPFCLSKCPYCDFNSHVANVVDQDRWRAALLREINHFAGEIRDRTVVSVFFGGGTPSLMDPGTVAAVIDGIREHWPTAFDLEITLEANPTSSEIDRFAALRRAGVNRLSVGVQAWDDKALTFLGRTHSASEAQAAVAMARAHFPRYSFDLMYGLPGQTVSGWQRHLVEALDFVGDHLSAYQLTIEPGTSFHRQGLAEIDPETAADLYEVTREQLATAGMSAYEVSNYARPGGECRHNLAVWQGGDYLGIGPGAHGRISGEGGTEAIRQFRAPEKWLSAVETHSHGTASRTALEFGERRDELMMMGLRLADGVGRERFRHLIGCEPEDSVDADGLARMIDGGFVACDTDGIRATPAGCQRLDAVLAQLLA